MKTEVISAEDPAAIRFAIKTLHAGGLVAFPTDTVYGLAANPFDANPIRRLFDVKGRDLQKAIPILLSGVGDLPRVALQMPSMAQKLAARFWPGPMTLIIWRRKTLPSELGPEPTVGVRVPDHPLALALLASAGPLAVTSANQADQPSSRTAKEVLKALGGRVDVVIDGGQTPGGEPSTVVDCTQALPNILRVGPISEREVLSTLT
jgi:L-threonylcarbamoyladenylate synthase